MKYEEFQRHLGKAGLSNREFSDILKMNRNSVSNYAKIGEVPSHLALIAALLGTLADSKIDFRAALENIEITAKKPRGGAAKGKFGGSAQTDFLTEQ